MSRGGEDRTLAAFLCLFSLDQPVYNEENRSSYFRRLEMNMMSLRYKCLAIDHDDTAVDSTTAIHYPAHVEAMRLLRPGHPVMSLEEFLRKNFDPGLLEYYSVELGMTDEELEAEFEIWVKYAEGRVPAFYEGFLEFLSEFRSRGGIVAVVSHSTSEIIERDYLSAGELMPDVIFGWDLDEMKRKPSPYPIREILRLYDLCADELLVVDDLMPGVLMAKAAGVSVAGAGWGHSVPEIEEYMRSNCTMYFRTVESLRDYVIED